MNAPKVGLSYFGNRYPHHARRDLAELAATGATIVDHVMSESDLRWNPETIAELVSIGRELGLEQWLAPWGLGGVFGGEAASYAVMEHPNQCQRDNNGDHLPALCLFQPAFRQLMISWLDAAAAARVDVVTWDEPHLALPDPKSPTDRWSCRCDACQRRFVDLFGHPMPVERTEEVVAFCQRTVQRTLDWLIEEGASRGLDSAVIFLPDDSIGDVELRSIAANPHVRYLGVSPYWIYQQIPPPDIERWLRSWCRRLVAATRGQPARSLAWIQAFSVPRGREAELELGMTIMREEGIEVIAVWSWRACEAMSELAPDDSALVWEIVQRGFRNLLDEHVTASEGLVS